MKCYAAISLFLILSIGCNRDEEARRKAAVNNLKQIGLALQNYHERHTSPVSEFSHVVTAETEYYVTGPQQSRPPEGSFPAGRFAVGTLFVHSRHPSIELPMKQTPTS